MRKDSGFTLIELMVTVAIAAILLGVAVPSFAEFIKNNRRAAAVNLFITDIHLARAEAAKRNQRVVICKRNPATVQPACSTAADWTDGWLVFVDNSAPLNSYDPANETLLAARPALSGELSMNSSATSYWFNRFNASLSDTIRFCSDNRQETGRKIVLDRGRPRTESLGEADTC
jgi:type IV fimbrial biogenesis protein FimT